MGYTKKQQDGGASNPKLIERDEKATAIRRQKSAARRARAKSGNGGVNQTLFDGVRKDRQERRDAAIARRQANETTQTQMRHEHQAEMALASPAITNLHEGSVARVFAEAIINAYTDARPRDGKGKTAVAADTALLSLTAEQRGQTKAIQAGRSAAYRALKGAYIKVTTPATV